MSHSFATIAPTINIFAPINETIIRVILAALWTAYGHIHALIAVFNSCAFATHSLTTLEQTL